MHTDKTMLTPPTPQKGKAIVNLTTEGKIFVSIYQLQIKCLFIVVNFTATMCQHQLQAKQNANSILWTQDFS